MKKVGIVTVTYNSHEVMPGFLQSIFAQTYTDWHLYVYDNDSEHKVYNQCKEYPKDKISYIDLKRNFGFATSSNLGIKHALNDECDYILLINNDTVFAPYLLAGLIAESQLNAAKIVAPKMLHYPETSIVWWGGGYFDEHQAQKNIHIGLGSLDDGRYDRSGFVDFAPMCCALVSKDVFNIVGYLDENYFIYYEDADWMYRAKLSEINVWYAANYTIYHKVSSLTGGARSRVTVYHATRGKVYFINKFYYGFTKYLWLLRYFIGFFIGLITGRYTGDEFKVKLIAFFSRFRKNTLRRIS